MTVYKSGPECDRKKTHTHTLWREKRLTSEAAAAAAVAGWRRRRACSAFSWPALRVYAASAKQTESKRAHRKMFLPNMKRVAIGVYLGPDRGISRCYFN